MTQISVQELDGESIISIPNSILSVLDLHEGSCLDIRVKDNDIVLTPTSKQTSLEDLIAGSPKNNMALTGDDEEWLRDDSMTKKT